MWYLLTIHRQRWSYNKTDIWKICSDLFLQKHKVALVQLGNNDDSYFLGCCSESVLICCSKLENWLFLAVEASCRGHPFLLPCWMCKHWLFVYLRAVTGCELTEPLGEAGVKCVIFGLERNGELVIIITGRMGKAWIIQLLRSADPSRKTFLMFCFASLQPLARVSNLNSADVVSKRTGARHTGHMIYLSVPELQIWSSNRIYSGWSNAYE